MLATLHHDTIDAGHDDRWECGRFAASYTFHSRIPVELVAVGSRSPDADEWSSLRQMSSCCNGPRLFREPSTFGTGTNALPSQNNNRQAVAGRTPRRSFHQSTSIFRVLIGWLHSYCTH